MSSVVRRRAAEVDAQILEAQQQRQVAAEADLKGPAPEISAGAPSEPANIQIPAEQNAPQNTAPEVSAPQPTDVHPDATDWKHKYDVINGKYRAEVPRLHAELRELRRELEDVKRAQVAAPAAPQKQPESVDDAVAVLERELGPELVEPLMRLIKREASNSTASVNQRVEQVERLANQSVAETKEAKLARLLSAEGIDFNRLDRDPGFIDWLNEVDTLFGSTRLEALRYAFHRQGDVERTANFYRTYHNAHKQPAPAAKPAPNRDLSQHVQVPASVPANDRVTTKEAQGPTWTRAQVNQFYADKRKGVYSPEDAARLEREIYAASAKGQIY